MLSGTSKQASYSALLHRELRWHCYEPPVALTQRLLSQEKKSIIIMIHTVRGNGCVTACVYRAVGLFDMRCAGCNIWVRSSGWAAASQLVFLKANRQQAAPAAAVRDSCGSCAHSISPSRKIQW